MSEFITQHDADHKFAKKSKANAGLTLGIIGTALGAGLLSGNGLGGILGGGAAAAATQGPTAWETYQKEVQDSVDLTKAFYQGRITDLQEKQQIYSYFENKFCAIDQRVTALEAAKPYEKEILDLKFQLATQNTNLQVQALDAQAKSYLTESMNFTRQLDCRNIKGELVLPNQPVVTGYGSYSPCAPKA